MTHTAVVLQQENGELFLVEEGRILYSVRLSSDPREDYNKLNKLLLKAHELGVDIDIENCKLSQEYFLIVPVHVLYKALEKISGLLSLGIYPEDEWETLTDGYELNTWSDEIFLYSSIYKDNDHCHWAPIFTMPKLLVKMSEQKVENNLS